MGRVILLIRLELLGGISHQFIFSLTLQFPSAYWSGKIIFDKPFLKPDNSLLNPKSFQSQCIGGFWTLCNRFLLMQNNLIFSFETICSKNTIASNNTHASCICYVIDVLSGSITLSQMNSMFISILGVFQDVFYKYHHKLV